MYKLNQVSVPKQCNLNLSYEYFRLGELKEKKPVKCECDS